MIEILKTDTFEKWYLSIKDRIIRARIDLRLTRIKNTGNFGDIKPVGEGVVEIRLQFGSGYRIYYTWLGDVVIILLAGGDKSTQSEDIEKAKELKKDLKK